MKKYSQYNNFNLIYKRVIQLLQFPLYFICKFIPKKNIIIFGSLAGYKIADNSKYKFINEYRNNCYFITKNKTILTDAIFDNVYPIYAFSLKGIFLQIFAKEAYYSHNIYDFTSPLIMGAQITMLGHGIHSKTWRKNFGIKGFIGKYIFPYANPDFCHSAYCPLESLKEQYKADFGVLKPNIIVKDFPRLYYAPKRKVERKVLFAPTFRGYRTFGDILNAAKILDESIVNLLNKYSIQLTIRPHPVDREYIKDISLPAEINFDTSDDLYETITSYAVIITDFSSIYFDAVYLNIPIYIIADDIEKYKQVIGVIDEKKFEKNTFSSITECLNNIINDVNNAVL